MNKLEKLTIFVVLFFVLVQIMLLLTLQEAEVLEVKMSIKVWCSFFQKIKLPSIFSFSSFIQGVSIFTVNTKVDMRFNVKNAYWLSDRVREKILQMVS